MYASSLSKLPTPKRTRKKRLLALCFLLALAPTACKVQSRSEASLTQATQTMAESPASVDGGEQDGKPVVHWGMPVVSFDNVPNHEGTEALAQLQSLIDAYLAAHPLDYRVQVLPIPVSARFPYRDGAGHVEVARSVPDLAVELWLSEHAELDLLSLRHFSLGAYYRGPSPYEAAAAAGLLLQLDSYLQGPAGERVTAAMGRENLEFCRIEHKLFGLGDSVELIAGALCFNRAALGRLGVEEAGLSGALADNYELLLRAQAQGYTPFAPDVPAFAIYNNGLSYASLENCPHLVLGAEGFQSYFDLPETEAYVSMLFAWTAEGLIESRGYHREPLEKELFSSSGTALESAPSLERLSAHDTGQEKDLVEALLQPDLAQVRLMHCSQNTLLAISSRSDCPDETFDWLSRIYGDAELRGLLTELAASHPFEFWAFFVTEEADPQLSARFAENVGDIPHRGFRFDTTPVQAEVDRCNALIGLHASHNEAELHPEVQKLYAFEGDPEAVLENVRRLLDEAGMPAVLAEANRQYEAWRRGP